MRICIFGASGTHLDKIYISETEKLASMLAKRGHSLIFGGGKNGLMGAAARGFTAGDGKIVGVTPEFFREYNVTYDLCDEMVWTESMRDRKKYMEDNADAFIVTPGGIGTYEEFFEVLTLKQLARHTKPIVLFNINGYFDKLLEIFSDNTEDGFIRAQTLELFKVGSSADEVTELIENDKFDIEVVDFTG